MKLANPSFSAHAALKKRWGSLEQGSAEWSLGVTASGASPRSKWLAWLGECPAKTPIELAALLDELGFADVSVPHHPARIRNIAIGFDGQVSVCIYLIIDAGSEACNIIERYDPVLAYSYSFQFFERGTGAVPSDLPEPSKRIVQALLSDPVVAKKSGYWRRSDDPRIYVTFPHTPPISHLCELLAGTEFTGGLRHHQDTHFRQVAVLGTEGEALTVYMPGSVSALPNNLNEARKEIDFATRWLHASAEVQQFILV